MKTQTVSYSIPGANGTIRKSAAQLSERKGQNYSVREKIRRFGQLILSVLFLTGASATAMATVSTLNPTADTDSQSDGTAGTNAGLNISAYCVPYFKFDLASVSGTVSDATLRVYFGGGMAATTITVSTTSNDTWVEGGTKPTVGSTTITTKTIGATGAGYIDFNVTAHVQSKMSGNKIVSVALANTLGGWTGLSSRQATSNKPLLVVTTGGSVPPAPTGLGATGGNAQISLSWTAASTAISYNIYRGTSAGGESPTPIITGITNTSYPDTGLINGTTYFYKVAGVNSTGTGAQSNEASAVPLAPGGTITLNPTADTDSQSDVPAGTNTGLNISQYCIPFLKFDLSGITGSVSDATLRLYFGGGMAATTLTVSAASNDTWSEGTAKPSAGSTIATKSVGTVGAGYVDVNITSYVQGKMSGNKIASIALANTLSGWTGFNSRQSGANKPQLVVTAGGGSTVSVSGITINPSSAFVTVNGSTTLTPTVTPSNATNKTLNWLSANATVATVNSSGVVTGHAVGSAGITAKSTDGSNITSNVSVVSVSAGGGTVSRPSYNTGNGFFVLNGKLYDANGVEFVIRGVNKLHWDSTSPGIVKTNANAVRWVIDFNQPTATNLNLMQGTINGHMVPIPGNWGSGSCPPESQLPGIVDEWIAQAAAWQTIDRYMILNIANELGGGNSTVWRDAYITAIGRLRAAGYLCTIMVDAGGCGQDVDDLANYAQAIFNSDPQKNIIFDQHIYGNWSSNHQQYTFDLVTSLDRLAATGLCFVIGEFGPGRNIGPSPTLITPAEIITGADSRNFGWLAWAWDDPAFNADENWFAMSLTSDYNSSADLTMFGKDVVENPSYGLKARAVKQTHF